MEVFIVHEMRSIVGKKIIIHQYDLILFVKYAGLISQRKATKRPEWVDISLTRSARIAWLAHHNLAQHIFY